MSSPEVFVQGSLDLTRRVCAELDRRVRAGETVRSEDYFLSFPGLAASEDSALEVILTEFAARVECGQPNVPEEWYERFPQWRGELEELFQLHELMTESHPEPGPGEIPCRVTSMQAAGSRLGHFELLEELGRGALGVVYKARDRKLHRLVALKVLRPGIAAAEDLFRFRQEADSIASLHHPHIVQIYEIGESEGSLYLSLEFMEGGSLLRKMTGTALPEHEAAELVETLARAMHYAHERGIVHRDLKPANILLTLDGIPKIADFSLAGHLDRKGRGAAATNRASPHVIVGTPGYMAPEQAGGTAQHIGPAADVHALGAIMHRLLTGRPKANADGANPRQRAIDRDLEAICAKCLQVKPEDRYADAGALADDLHRWSTGQPVVARPVGVGEQVWKWSKRHPASAALVAVTVVGLLVLLAIILSYNVRLSDALVRARKSQAEASQGAVELKNQLTRSRRSLYNLQLNHAQAVWDRDPSCGKVMLEDLGYCPKDLRDYTWSYLYRLCRRKSLELRMPGPANAVAVTPDGRTLAIGYELPAASNDATGQGRIAVLDLASGKERCTLAAPDGPVTAVVFDPGGRILAAATGCPENAQSGSLRLWDAKTWQQPNTLDQRCPPIWSLAFNADSTLLASAGSNQPVRLWDASTGRTRSTLHGQASLAHTVAFVPRSNLLATGGNDRAVHLWNVETGREESVLGGHKAGVLSLSASPDGRLLASGSADATVFLWDLRERRARTILHGHEGSVRSLAFSPDGQTLASGSEDYTPKLWHVSDGRNTTTLNVHGDHVTSVAFTPDGQRFLSAGRDGFVKAWDVVPGRQRPPLVGHKAKVVAALTTPDGRGLVTASQDRSIKVWDLASGQPAFALPGQSGAGCCLALSPDGWTLASATDDHAVKLWDLANGIERLTLRGHTERVSCLAFSPDGALLATGSFDRTVRIWDLAQRRIHTILTGHTGKVNGLAFAPDGRRLATASDDTTVRLWDAGTGEELAQAPAHEFAAVCVAFHPDGETLVSGGRDWKICTWDAETLTKRQVLLGHSDWVLSIIFSPDGKTMVSATGDKWPNARGEVKLWDPVTGHVRATLPGQTAPIAFSADSGTLITGNQDETLNLLESARLDF
jgi:WD40 repeat protein/tRNA A-37 threonylcarbamoyl transferase component Bud32